MLRITVHDKPELRTFQVEGTLAEPLVQELERCWDATHPVDSSRAVQIDLTGVTYVDESGKTLLAALHAQGATFVCAGCRIRAIVAEIANTH
jgi:anti-anti-sigma regulatory factor